MTAVEPTSGNERTHHGVLRVGRTIVWRCEHNHVNASSSNACSYEELQRRARETQRRTRIRLPGIHADIVLEKHAGTRDTGDGVEMTVAREELPHGDYSKASVELTSFGVAQLINALAEVAGLPFDPS